jgi:2-oxoglutarate/2-oxoacid ferredoxin oxidoreductase subunit alpha
MTQMSPGPSVETPQENHSVVNDFAITFCTVNGSGSATANLTLMRALFKMGIPVSGKNIFPSNIQGLPTWYTLRVNKNGYTARVEKDDLIVAMNPATFSKDQSYLVPGGVVFYSDDINQAHTRDDVTYYPMPIKQLIKGVQVPPALKDFIANMVYVGVVGQLLGIDLDAIFDALNFHFQGKKTPVESNFTVVRSAYDWAAENLTKEDPYRVEKMDATQGLMLAEGNLAAALGAIYGGVQFVGWYPITPASSLTESLYDYLPKLRTDPETGKQNYVVVQAEDELAAIGMSVGAGWAGLRSMTATSGPGFSLMSEYLGLAYYSEVPLVVWDVQRVGPSTGLPTRTAQGDISQAYYSGHGDKNYILLFPGSVKECYEFGWKAFDIAERMQMPVIVLSDLDLGMNTWMTPKFNFPDQPMDRGKVLWEDDIRPLMEKIGGPWGRYLDVDGDGIPYRTVPGNRHPKSAYFSRGTGHDEYARYSEEPEVWERNMARLAKKYITAKQYVPGPVLNTQPGAMVGILAVGSTQPAIDEARDLLLDAGLPTDYMRIRSIPFADEIEDFLQAHERVYVPELNRDGQLHQLLTIHYPQYAQKLRKTAHLDGLPFSARWLKDEFLAQEVK